MQDNGHLAHHVMTRVLSYVSVFAYIAAVSGTALFIGLQFGK